MIDVEWHWLSLDGESHASLRTRSGRRMHLCRSVYTDDEAFPSEPAVLHPDSPECLACVEGVMDRQAHPERYNFF